MTLKNTLLALTLIASSRFAYGQAPLSAQTAPSGIPGYLDAKTGAFRPIRQEAPDAAAVPNIAATTGKIVFTYNVAIQSSIPTSTPISCGATAFVSEINSTTYIARNFTETAIVTGSRSGNNVTCTATIPYSWALASPSNDSIMLAFAVYAGSTSTATLSQRTTTQDLPPIKVPVNGATTTQSISATL